MEIEVRFGALSDPIHKQLDVPPSTVEHEQKLADAITLCHIAGVLTDAETDKARRRLFKRLQKKSFEEA